MMPDDELRDLAACTTRFQHAVVEIRKLHEQGLPLYESELPGIAYRACEGIRAFAGGSVSEAANVVRLAHHDVYKLGWDNILAAYERLMFELGG